MVVGAAFKFKTEHIQAPYKQRILNTYLQSIVSAVHGSSPHSCLRSSAIAATPTAVSPKSAALYHPSSYSAEEYLLGGLSLAANYALSTELIGIKSYI